MMFRRTLPSPSPSRKNGRHPSDLSQAQASPKIRSANRFAVAQAKRVKVHLASGSVISWNGAAQPLLACSSGG